MAVELPIDKSKQARFKALLTELLPIIMTKDPWSSARYFLTPQLKIHASFEKYAY